MKPDEIGRYLAYEAAFVVAPGVLLLGAISPGTRTWLWRVSLGWPLGLLLEVTAFTLTAALDLRGVLLAYPILVGVPAAIIWRRRLGRRIRHDGVNSALGWRAFTTAQRWVLAGLCILSFGYFGLTMIALFPLQGTVPNVFYGPDTVFLISVVAEALNHWPIQEPQVAGVTLNYHYMAELHVASICQVTGISPSVAYTRLWWIPLLALSVVQAGVAGRVIGKIAWLGPLTAGMFLLVRGFDMTLPLNGPFFDYHGLWLTDSPSYLLSIVFFLPLVLLLAGLLEQRFLQRIDIDGRPAVWALVILFAVASAGAKPTVLPVIIGGLGLLCAYAWLQDRTLNRTALAGLGVCAGSLALFVFLLYGGNDSGGYFEIDPGGVYEWMHGLNAIQLVLPDSGAQRVIVEIAAALAGTVLLFAPSLVGLVWVLRRGSPPLGDAGRFMLFVLLTGVVAMFVLHDQSAAEVYFLQYGLIAAMPLLAVGVWRALTPWMQGPASERRSVLVALTGWLMICFGLAFAGWKLTLDGTEAGAYALVYLPLFIVFGGMLVAVRLAPPSRRPARVALVVLALVVPAAFDLALDTVPETARKALKEEPLYVYQYYGFTPDDNRAANWIRENLDEDAVLSISNQTSRFSLEINSSHTEYPAFAERRAFYEGWVYSTEAVRMGRHDVLLGRTHPYPERRDLELRVFREADRDALAVMRSQYGVTHIVVDRDDGRVNPRVYDFGRIAYVNPGVQVIELPPS